MTAFRRRIDLVAEEIGDETLIYDPTSQTTHCLSPLASLVWRRCSEPTELEALRTALAGTDREAAEGTLSALFRCGFFEPVPTTRTWSRREVVRAAAALPAAVVSFRASQALAAGSCSGLHVLCGAGCCGGLVCVLGICVKASLDESPNNDSPGSEPFRSGRRR